MESKKKLREGNDNNYNKEKVNMISSQYQSNLSSSIENKKTFQTDIEQHERNTYYDLYYKTGPELRISYYEKLILHTVYKPSTEYKTGYNSIIIFDWDDTLLPSCYLKANNYFNLGKSMPFWIKELFVKMEFAVMRILTLAIQHGDTYIVTNASPGWVEYSQKVYYPCLGETLRKVRIISARGDNEKKYPMNETMWKIETFKELRKIYKDVVTNVVCLGDSRMEWDAAQKMCSEFTESYLKIIKLIETPRPEQMTKQLMLVADQFTTIHSIVKNRIIFIGKKTKN